MVHSRASYPVASCPAGSHTRLKTPDYRSGLEMTGLVILTSICAIGCCYREKIRVGHSSLLIFSFYSSIIRNNGDSLVGRQATRLTSGVAGTECLYRELSIRTYIIAVHAGYAAGCNLTVSPFPAANPGKGSAGAIPVRH